jgi:squalene-associated FAD-dependent desaturase
MTRCNVAIIGGGWAGLAAAVELTTRGIPVTVFEAAPHLGGRARGFERYGQRLDNGQHLLLGAYRETLRLMRLVGTDTQQALLRLPLHLETPGHLRLVTPRLPAPWHLLAGLLMADGLSWNERLAAIRFMVRQRRAGFRLAQDMSVAELLADQPEKLVRLLWEPLCLAALNTPIANASAQVLLHVLRDSFSRARSDSDLLLPRLDLSVLFPDRAADYIEAHGGTVHRSMPVTTLDPVPDGIRIGDETFSHVVCAVAPHVLPRLLGRLPKLTDVLGMVGRMRWQPIATLYLQYAQTLRLPFPMLGLQGGYAQWLFDRGALCGQPGLLAAVISAEGPHLQLEHDTLAAAVHGEVQRLTNAHAAPIWHQVIVEKRATFACTAGVERPHSATPHPRIFLAGDYTAGDYPSTLEGAVRSGVQCAHLLLATAP